MVSQDPESVVVSPAPEPPRTPSPVADQVSPRPPSPVCFTGHFYGFR